MRDEDAPWLAEAAPLNQSNSAAQRRPVLNIAIAVLALGAIAAVGLLMMLGGKDGGNGQGYMEASQAPLIEADAGPYRVAPADRQGLELEGDGDVIYDAVRGDDVQSQIDMNAVPEEPIGRPRDLLPPGASAPPPQVPAGSQPVTVQVLPAQPSVAPPSAAQPGPAQPASAPKPRPPVAAAPAAAKQAPVPTPAIARIARELQAAPPAATAKPAASAATVQIGAFSSAAKADEEWARVGGKAKLTGKQVQKLTNADGRTLWRVRGQTSDADAACKAILAAKGACEVVKAKG